MDPTQLRPLGRSGVPLTQLGFGGVALGELYARLDDDEAHATVAAAWSTGTRYFDTAPLYGLGLSEHRVGRYLRSQPRESFVLSTKVGRVLRRPKLAAPRPNIFVGGLPFDFDFDYSYDGIMRSFEDSLQRLGINSVDLLVIHDLDLWHHQTETRVGAHLSQLLTSGWRALEELRATNQIRGIGAGINELETIFRLVPELDLDFVLLAMRYTLLEQEALDTALPMLAAREVGVIVGSVFNSGILATGPIEGAKYNYQDASPEILQRVTEIKAICDRYGVPLAAAALQFPLGHPSVASVIPGAFRPEQVETNRLLFEHQIPDELWLELKSAGCISSEAPTPLERAA